MLKRLRKLALLFIVCISLTGCWNYRGLDELAIVAGISIARDPLTQQLILTFETVDPFARVQETGPQAKLLQSRGSTIYDAVKNMQKSLSSTLYFGNTQLAIIDYDLAKDEGVASLFDWLMRNTEMRETLSIAIAHKTKADDFFKQEDKEAAVLSFELERILYDQHSNTATSKDVLLYQGYNRLHSPGTSLVLPALHRKQGLQGDMFETHGLAVFKNDKLLGLLSSEQTQFSLFATNDVRGGALTFNPTGQRGQFVSLEVTRSRTKLSHTYVDGVLTINLDITTHVILSEVEGGIATKSEGDIRELSLATADFIEKGIQDVVDYAQKNFATDLFGFGLYLYQNDPKLFEALEPDWDAHYQQLIVNAQADVLIKNTVLLR